MHQARNESLQQLALAEHVGDLGFDARRCVVETSCRFPGTEELDKKKRAAREQRDGDDEREYQRA
ncbi:MAG TPA: hypothetical protein VKE27_11440 [Candidatus Dormibacteraeota bacterium]|nr:hypothetical protein [Candidatus Dormibacteraeota bacterium]